MRKAIVSQIVFEITNGGFLFPLEEGGRLMIRFLSVLSVFAIIFVATRTATAGTIISTPAGLNPGDHFRIAFITSDPTVATSTDISTYDSYVTSQANHATYNGNTITWKAIGSTSSVSAIDHIGVTNAPVYLVEGTKVANADNTSVGGLWSGTLFSPIHLDIYGSPQLFTNTWTGTNLDGAATPTAELGSTDTVEYGSYYYQNQQWIEFYAASPQIQLKLYGISDILTVPGAAAVPEPSTAMLAAVGGIGIAIRSYRRRKAI